jgi:hypothetical protein
VSKLNSKDQLVFKERVSPNIGTFAAVAVLIPAVTLVSEPFDFRIGLVIGFLLVAAIWAILLFYSPKIEVGKELLSVGRASIPRALLGEVLDIPKEKVFFERGPGLDPASYKVFQGTVKTAVKIVIEDPDDPTPYWIVSTRKPAELAAALNSRPKP